MSINGKHNKMINRLVDLIVLSVIFYLSSHIIPSTLQTNILLNSLMYAIVIVVSLQFCKNLMSSTFKSANAVVQLMLNNATGLLVGTCIMFVIGFMVSSLDGLAIVAIPASIISFFVLGTVYPLAKSGKRITQ